MSNLSQIELTDATVVTLKDNSQTRSDHRHYDTDRVPLVHKVYESTGYYASANDYANASWYFMSIKPDEWGKPWRIKFKVHSYCPSYTSTYQSYTWSTICGRADGFIYANWNERYSSAHSYILLYPLKSAGFTAGYGHALAISIYNADNRTSSAYYRTFEVDLYDTENCTVEFLDTPVKWASWTGGTSTNYGSLAAYNAIDRGLQETGDTNDIDNRILYFAGKTGAKGVWATSLFMEDAYGTYQNICTASDGTVTSSNRTTGTKYANTNGFKVGSPIWYTNTNYNANTNISGYGNVYKTFQIFDTRYSFNTTLTAGSLTAYKPLYLVGTIHSDGLYYLDTTWWTQTPTDQSKIYVLVGGVYDSTTSNCRATLYEQNSWFRYDGTQLIEIANDALTVSGHTVATDVPSGAVFTDTTYTFAGGTNSFTVTPSGGSAQTVNVTPSIANAEMLTTNAFAPTSLKGPYISKIDNAFYAADKRWTVTATNMSGSVATLFDGDYESGGVIQNGNTSVITMDFSNESSGYFPGYPYGYILISFYYASVPQSVSCRVYCNYSTQGVGWHNVAITKVSDSTATATTYRSEHQGYYQISQIEITIVGDTTNSTGYTKVSQIEMHLDRPNSKKTPFLSKYGEEELYYNLTAPKFIGNLQGNADTASALTTNAGSMLNPVYFSSGVPVASSGNSIPFIVGTGSTAGTWLGTLTGLTAYYDGLLILYKPSVAGASTTTLNINNLGAKTIYINKTSLLTTHFPKNQPILLVYSVDQNSGCWMCLDDYWTDSDTYDRNRYKVDIKAGSSAIVAGNIIVANSSNLYHHLKDGTAFDIRNPILYANAAIAANATGTNNYDVIPFAVATTQSITLTAYAPVYIKGTLSGTTFTPDSTAPLTQTAPSTADGKYYMLLGVAYSTTAIYLSLDHRIFAYKNGAFGEVVNDALSVNGYTIATSVPSGAVFTDTKNTAGSTDTSSKIFLIGATSQAANPQTYSDDEVFATSGVLTTKSVQVGGGSATMQYNSTTQAIDFVFT